MSNTNTASKKNLAQTAAFANLLSGACASPLVYKTVNLSGSYQPVVTLTNAIEFLSEIGAQPVAFDLALAWFSIVGREVPEVLASIESDSELAAAFVDELTLDLESIIEEDLSDEDEDDFDDEPDDPEE